MTMRTLTSNDLTNIINGASVFATGGGGTIGGAVSILNQITKPVNLVSFKSLRKRDIVCTVFGVGGKQNCNPVVASEKAFSLFQKVTSTKVSAIIPVEIGPMAIANVMYIASELNLPILDSDIVGMRSSPEVFLEIISLANLDRTPCAIADDKGNSAILFESQNLEQLENFLRGFAISVGGDAFVAGYPLKVESLLRILPSNSITSSQIVGELVKRLKSGKIGLKDFCKISKWKLYGTGIIKGELKNNLKGFAQGKYKINSDKGIFTIVFKNENIALFRNDTLLLTCPDSITLLNIDSGIAINNFENNKDAHVAILVKKAIPIWRTKKGRELFSPKNLGYDFSQKLLT